MIAKRLKVEKLFIKWTGFAVLALSLSLSTDSLAQQKKSAANQQRARSATGSSKSGAGASRARSATGGTPNIGAARMSGSQGGGSQGQTHNQGSAGSSPAASTSTRSNRTSPSRGTGSTASTGTETPAAGTGTTAATGTGSSYGATQCRASYVECMDAQVKDIVGRYGYLDEDPAILAAVKGDQPFRCLFFDVGFSKLTEQMNAVRKCMETEENVVLRNCTFGSFDSRCSFANNASARKSAEAKCRGRDINHLYYSYNYYCDLETSSAGNALGRTTNHCRLAEERVPEGCEGILEKQNPVDAGVSQAEWDKCVRGSLSNVFATQDSIAYYREANKRFDESSLRMVNFTQSNLYKEKIATLGLDALKAFDVSSLLQTETNCESYEYRDHLGNTVSITEDRWYELTWASGTMTESKKISAPADKKCADHTGKKPENGTGTSYVCLPREDITKVQYRYNAQFGACQKFSKVLNRFTPVSTLPAALSKPTDFTYGYRVLESKDIDLGENSIDKIKETAVNFFLARFQERGIKYTADEIRGTIVSQMDLSSCKNPGNSATAAELELYVRCIEDQLANYCGGSSFFDPNSRQCATCEQGGWNSVIRACQSGMEPMVSQADVDFAEAEARFQSAIAGGVDGNQANKARAQDLQTKFNNLKAQRKTQVDLMAGMENMNLRFDYSVFYAPGSFSDSSRMAPRDIYTDLGLQRTNALFSINVVPPIGAGELFPNYLFGRASDYCFDGTRRGKNAAEMKKFQQFNRHKTILAGCGDHRDNLERYYLASLWPNAQGVPVEQTFLSAKRSCDIYEQALVSVRDRFFGEFDTKMKNYLEDAVAQVLASHLKQVSKIATIAESFQEWDHQMTQKQMEIKTKMRARQINKLLTEAERANEALAAKIKADRKEMEERKRILAVLEKQYKTDLLDMCGLAGGSMMENAQSGKVGRTVGMLSALFLRLQKPEDYKNLPPIDQLKMSAVRPSDTAFASCKQDDIPAIMQADCALAALGGDDVKYVEYKKSSDGKTLTASSDSAGFNPPEGYVDFVCADWGDEFLKHPRIQSGLARMVEKNSSTVLLHNAQHGANQNPEVKGTLMIGVYQVILAGGGGGSAGCKSSDKNACGGGAGGYGGAESNVYLVLEPTSFTLSAGVPGSAGSAANGAGTGGGTSKFTLAGQRSIEAIGGGGGSRGSGNNAGVDGKSGAQNAELQACRDVGFRLWGKFFLKVGVYGYGCPGWRQTGCDWGCSGSGCKSSCRGASGHAGTTGLGQVRAF